MVRNLLLLPFLFVILHSQAQPNDACVNAINISDGNWWPGDNNNATYNCTSDHRTGHCGSPSGCTAPLNMTNSSNMCCGIEGVESSIWYTFRISTTDVVFVDFRNISCNPTSFFGTTTALQGFILRRKDSLMAGPLSECNGPCMDTTKACFNANNANDVNGQMSMTAKGGQKYFIQLDTKKNAFSGCGGCASPSGSCHSDCTFEIRIRRANPPLAVITFAVNDHNQGVGIDWQEPAGTGHNFYQIKRVKEVFGAETKVLAQGSKEKFFSGREGHFYFLDQEDKEPGVYTYYLLGSDNNVDFELVANDEINYLPNGKPFISLFPNPSTGVFMLKTNFVYQEQIPYTIYNSIGAEYHKGVYNKTSVDASLDLSFLAKGNYFIILDADGHTFSQKLSIIK